MSKAVLMGRLLALLGVFAVMGAGGYAGYAEPWLFGLRPDTPDARYAPLAGVISGIALGILSLMIVRLVRRQSKAVFIARLLALLGVFTVLGAGGGYVGYAEPWLFGLRPDTPDVLYGPLAGVLSGTALGILTVILGLALRPRSARPGQEELPTPDWQELYDPVDLRPAPSVVACGLCYAASECECPRCDVCGQKGDPGCYMAKGRLNHGLAFSPEVLERQASLAGAVLMCGLCQSKRGCDCPRCDVCGQRGNPGCYVSGSRVNHGLRHRPRAERVETERPAPVLPSIDWLALHDPAGLPGPEEERASAPVSQWREPSKLQKLMQGALPGPRSGKFIGPRMPMTLEAVAQRAQTDDFPLRGKDGGRLSAAEYPEVLDRQWREWTEMFGERGGGGGHIPRPVFIGGLAIAAVLLVGLGYAFGPMFLGGVQGGVVAGAKSTWQTLMPFAGAALGLVMSAVLAWIVLAWMGAGKDEGKVASKYEQVYAPARITQVAYRNDSGREVDAGAPDARRYVLRRMITDLMRAPFANRQEGIFVSGEKMSRDQLFRNGEIRLETTKDLSKLTKPQELYDAGPLSGRWRGVSSLRWYVALRNPIETGMAAREWEIEGESKGGAGRFFTSNAGFLVLAICLIGGTIMFFAALDHKDNLDHEAADLMDRTPKIAREAEPRIPPGTN